MANDDYSPDIAPIDCAMELLSDIEEANETPILDLFQTSYIRLALMLCPGVKTIIPSPNVIYYEIEAVAASDISIAATGNPEAYDMLSEICPANIYMGQAIPKEIRAICSQLVCGQFKPPSRRGPKAADSPPVLRRTSTRQSCPLGLGRASGRVSEVLDGVYGVNVTFFMYPAPVRYVAHNGLACDFESHCRIGDKGSYRRRARDQARRGGRDRAIGCFLMKEGPTIVRGWRVPSGWTRWN